MTDGCPGWQANQIERFRTTPRLLGDGPSHEWFSLRQGRILVAMVKSPLDEQRRST
jgi:hypothetical protein